MGRELIGPIHSEMYVQNLQTPKELWETNQGDFNKIYECAVKAMFEELNGTGIHR